MCHHVISEKPTDVLQKCAISNTRSFKTFVNTIAHGADEDFTNFPKHVEATFKIQVPQGRHEASSIVSAHVYLAEGKKFSSPGNLAAAICELPNPIKTSVSRPGILRLFLVLLSPSGNSITP